MISYVKELRMKIQFFSCADGADKRIKPKDLPLSYVPNDKFGDTLRITVPGTEADILVDAVWMKEACEKCIAMRKL